MNNTRFATTIHIMTLLTKCPDRWLTSDWIAGSININPVIVRKEISVLKLANLVVSRQGKDGGVQLAKSADSIQISDIYAAIKNSEVLGKKNRNPNPACSIGKEINKHLNKLYVETDYLVHNFLAGQSLKNFSDNFN